MHKIPIRTKAQKLGVKTETLLYSILSEIYIIKPFHKETDFGVDFHCQLLEKISKNRDKSADKVFYVS
ncbi:MAG: hypothetical protein ACFFD2_16575 [Promethearchaeota archaeon]